MRNKNTIQSKTEEMLRNFHQKKIHVGFSLFLKKKLGLQERKQIRKEMIFQIKNHKSSKPHQYDFDWNTLLKIGEKPYCPFAGLSISHCHHLGAFLFSFDSSISIGFDMEDQHRITKKLIHRISSKQEINQAPSPSFLWTAKEASLKCLSNNQSPLLLSDCLISHWKKEKYFSFFNGYSKKIDKSSIGITCITNGLFITCAKTNK